VRQCRGEADEARHEHWVAAGNDPGSTDDCGGNGLDVATLCVYRPGDAERTEKVQAQLLTQSLNMIDAFNESLKITTRQFEKVLLGRSVAHSPSTRPAVSMWPEPQRPHWCWAARRSMATMILLTVFLQDR
jgi:hypothetical protein